MHETCLAITCEHGGNDIPADYKPQFAGLRDTLDSHRGYDPGALELARCIAGGFDAPLFYSTVSRLLIDCNRSLHNRSLFSKVSRSFTRKRKDSLIECYYHPFRQPVESFVSEKVRKGCRVLHLSVHTFTPVLEGNERSCDIGLLYDPGRTVEREFCIGWQMQLQRLVSDLVIRRNYPYRGTSDGFVSLFRKRYGPEDYLGFEIEVNHKHFLGKDDDWRRIEKALVKSFGIMYLG